ncbi:hypothetical protein CXB51_004712 [Gossypium anomalum]|uniref:ABC transporter domain-containing protein n=1 Tax=Gossypium anomalum TaxID=47600 RepID=A0A8J5ZHQ9_9ROSI|nr:hypothetical protein CXB51_004712 [Gossypium anomalum]
MVWLSKISRSQSAESGCLVQLPPTVTLPPRRGEFVLFSCRDNATESVAIVGCNINFSVNTRQGKMVPFLKDCSIRIPSGQLWMLLEPNGCGKSTLLFLPDSCGCFLNLMVAVAMPTVEADVAFGLGRLNLTNSKVRSRVSKALDAVGMSEYLHRPVQTLSDGQKRRVAIVG